MTFRSVEYSLYVCIVATILTRLICGTVQQYKHIGCYKDDSHDRPLIWIRYVNRNNAIEACAVEAQNKGYSTFAIEYYTECWSGPDANKTYDKHGKSTACINGVGGSLAFDVYQFTDEILWPEGTYSLLKPSSGCPTEWLGNGWIDNGWIIQDTDKNVKNNRSSVLNIDGYVTSNYVVRSFCTKTKRTSPTWPKGQYCIYKGDTKPTDMKDSWIRMDNNWKNPKTTSNLEHKDSINMASYNIYIYFFCQTSGVKSQAIDLPITHPFYLLPYGSTECQQVKWMVATTEWIQYATLNYQGQTGMKYGSIPYIEIGSKSHKGLKMFYCLYESCNRTLSDMKGTFQSPRFPDKYPDGQLCSWKIQVLANHTIHVDFTTFSLAVEHGNDTDVLEYYTSTRGSLQLVKVYRGRLESFKVHSTSDLMFVFRSNQANSSSGFNAEYDIIPDQDPTTNSSFSTQQPTNPLTDDSTSSHNTVHDFTSENPSRTEIYSIQPTSRPTTVSFELNNSSYNSFYDNRGGTGTTILIVIPLVCFILVLVVTIDIIYRCRNRLSFCLKNKKEDPRFDDGEQVTVNPIYGTNRSEPFRMNRFNSTLTVTSTISEVDDEDDDQSYERLSRNVLPKHDVPEQYDQLNQTSEPIRGDHGRRLPLQNDGPVYQTLNRSNSEPTANHDDQVYQSIDQKPSSSNLYERNILYDRVA